MTTVRERVGVWVAAGRDGDAAADLATTAGLDVVSNVELAGVPSTVIGVDRDRYGRAAELFCVKAVIAALLTARDAGAEVRVEVFGTRSDPGVRHLIANAERNSISGTLHAPHRRRR